jgi:hypothetical protein
MRYASDAGLPCVATALATPLADPIFPSRGAFGANNCAPIPGAPAMSEYLIAFIAAVLAWIAVIAVVWQ